MFDKNDIESRWAEYLYRELEDPEQARFVQTVQSDQKLEAEEQEWRDLLSQFDMMASIDNEVEVPPELVFRVKRQISLYQDWNAQTWGNIRKVAAASIAACVLIGLLSWAAIKPITALQSERNFLQPLREHVLSLIYDRSVLKLYKEEGVIDDLSGSKSLVHSPDNHEHLKDQDTPATKQDSAL